MRANSSRSRPASPLLNSSELGGWAGSEVVDAGTEGEGSEVLDVGAEGEGVRGAGCPRLMLNSAQS